MKPCVLYGVEVWKLTPDILAKIITAERYLSRWCLRMRQEVSRTEAEDNPAAALAAWIQWKADSAREVARVTARNKTG